MPGPQFRDKDKVSGGLSCLLLRPPAALRSAKSYDFEFTAARSNELTALPATSFIFLICFITFSLKQIQKIEMVSALGVVIGIDHSAPTARRSRLD